MSEHDLSQLSLLQLFRMDAESQIQALIGGLLVLERDKAVADQLAACMRAAHSLKGAASIVGLDAGVRVAHAMEDSFVAAQRGALALDQAQIDVLLRGADLLKRIAATPEDDIGQWSGGGHAEEVAAFHRALAAVTQRGAAPVAPPRAGEAETELTFTTAKSNAAIAPNASALPTAAEDREWEQAARPASAPFVERRSAAAAEVRENADRVLRVSAEKLDRLMGFAGESLVESRWLQPFGDSLLRIKRMQEEALQALEIVAASLAETNARDVERLEEIRQCVRQCHESLSQRIDELETTEGRSTELAHRLYDAVLDSRMRPLADGVHAFPRMVRDLARALGKEVRLELVGQAVQVDRDVLEKLESPLGHLLRNATDHGIESPDARRMAGKPAIGLVRLEARHSAGLLQIVVSDDGRGVDLDRVRHAVLARNLASEDAVQRMSEAEVLEFLFLPGFTLKETVTDVSGRGVGLDAVRNMVRQLRGSVRVSAQPGAGTRVQLQLPLTLSVVRALLIAVAGEPYAIPLTQIVRALRVPRRVVHSLEGREYLEFDGRSVGLVSAQLVLDVEAGEFSGDELAVVMIGGGGAIYGLVVEAFLGERELVVQPLDPRFGKLQDIAAGGLLEDGSPVLIVDVEDMVRSVEKLVSSGELGKAGAERSVRGGMRRRVLVVDDSLTVRELERKLLDHAGYEVEVAVDGMDGWNALRTGRFDLVVTDVDMPRLGGIELVEMIRRDARLKTLPVMIVSYKDRDEDRRRGLEAGADYYLPKGSFQDETLLQAVVDLIGSADARAPT